MRELYIDRPLPSPDGMLALDRAMRATLGDRCEGLTGSTKGIRVHLSDTATTDDEAAATQLVITHDFSQRTAEQLYLEELKRVVIEGRAKYTLANLDSDLLRYLFAEIALIRNNHL